MRVSGAAAPPTRTVEWHVISCEYPPQVGGVSDYVASVAKGLAEGGRDVHVWCPPTASNGPERAGVIVHRELGQFTPRDLRRVDRLLDRYARPRRLIIQWVPHGYGYRSLNLGFCLWARGRASKGDVVDIMVHEPFLRFAGAPKQWLAATAHRLMTVALLSGARRVWVSTPAWRKMLEPYALGRDLGFSWLPIPSPVEPIEDPEAVNRLRHGYAPGQQTIVGHFGMYSRLTAPAVTSVMRDLLKSPQGLSVLLLGEGSEALRRAIVAGESSFGERVHAAGVLALPELSHHLQACDVVVQPYPEGITGRRTSAMAPLAHGKAIVTTEGPVTESVWRESGAVRLVPVGSAADLTTAVKRLVAEPSIRIELGRRAARLYRDVFDVSHTVEELLAS